MWCNTKDLLKGLLYACKTSFNKFSCKYLYNIMEGAEAIEEVSVKSNDLKKEQWASRLLGYSSQYNDDGWSARSALGSPRVYPQYGDREGAWASSTFTSAEYIELGYTEAMFAKGLEIYETYNCGAVVKIEAHPVHGAVGGWKTVWEAPDGPQRIQMSRVFTPEIQTKYKIDAIRLTLDCTLASTWAEIDAVKLIGQRFLIDTPFPTTSLGDDLAQLVNGKEFSDVTFEVGGKQVFAHRAILCARSEYFRAMFSEASEKFTTVTPVVPMPDIGYDALLGVMQYLYTNTLDKVKAPVDLVELVRISDLYNMPGLKTLATYQIYSVLSADNVVVLFREAVEHLPVLTNIEEMCSTFMSENLQEVSTKPDFCKLPQPVMLEIIQKCAANLSLK